MKINLLPPHAISLKTPLILLMISVSGLLVGCSNNSQSQYLRSVARTNTVTLSKNKAQGHVHSLTISARGKLNGTAELQLLKDGKPYRTEKLTDNVEVTLSGDWYADDATLKYTPITATDGKIKLTYAFADQ